MSAISSKSVCIGLFVVIGLATAAAPGAYALKTNEASDVSFTGHVLEPRKAKLEDLGAISVPQGFELSVFAKDLINPRMIAVAQNGDVYVTRRSVGDVVLLRDKDGDGKADESKVVASRPQMHGIAIDGETIYLATVKDVFKASLGSDGTLGELQRIIDDLPDGGQHPNRTLGIGPDGMLYISVGSTCNACAETSPESATILRASPDGAKRTIFASGLRNTIGFAWQPETGALYGMDHNIDWHGDDQPEEELNLLEEGKKYGWPYVLAGDFLNPQDDPPGDLTLEDWAAASEKPSLLYTAHSAPMQMTFYAAAQYPASYRGNAFVAMRGSWNRNPPSGYEIVRIVFEDGKPARFEPFVTGFVSKEGGKYTRTARLAGIAVDKSGALLFSDDENGVIYRLSHKGNDGEINDEPPGSPTATKPQDAPPPRKQIALEAAGAREQPNISLTSTSFKDKAPIPLKHADYGQKISPPLAWSKGPEGAKSYAIVMDDPDAKPKLVNHWGIYNIPASLTALPEGVPGDPSLVAPKGAAQTATTRGTPGYFGPRPPAGDPPHRYHFQIFALDTVLELPPNATADDLIKAMTGHVVGAGLLTGLFGRDADVQKTVDNARDVTRAQ